MSCTAHVLRFGFPYRRRRIQAHGAKRTSPDCFYRGKCYSSGHAQPRRSPNPTPAGTLCRYNRRSPISTTQRAARLLESRRWASGFHYSLSLKAAISPKRVRTLRFPPFHPPRSVLKHQDPKKTPPCQLREIKSKLKSRRQESEQLLRSTSNESGRTSFRAASDYPCKPTSTRHS